MIILIMSSGTLLATTLCVRNVSVPNKIIINTVVAACFAVAYLNYLFGW